MLTSLLLLSQTPSIFGTASYKEGSKSSPSPSEPQLSSKKTPYFSESLCLYSKTPKTTSLYSYLPYKTRVTLKEDFIALASNTTGKCHIIIVIDYFV